MVIFSTGDGKSPVYQIPGLAFDMYDKKCGPGNEHFAENDISLPIDQFNQFLVVLPEVEAALIGKGHTVQRPIYDDRSKRW